MGAKKKEIRVVEQPVSEGKQLLEKVYVPQSEKKTLMIEGSVDQQVEKMMEIFKNDIKVL